MKKNDLFETAIIDITNDGDGIGKINEMIVFIPNSAIGDNALIRILKVKKNYAYGKIEKILKPSKDRIATDCNCNKACGGCVFREISYESELKIKHKRVSDCLSRIGNFKNILIEQIVGSERINGYRNKVQIPVREDNNNITTGFFSKSTHRIVPFDKCNLHPDVFDKIIDLIKEWMAENQVLPYDEVTHKGLIRHIYLRCSKDEKEVMVCLVINGNTIPSEDKLINKLISHHTNIKSILFSINDKKTNVILGNKCKTIFGKDNITDTLCGLRFDISPLSFYQVNRDQAEKLYKIAKDCAKLKKDDVLLDLYCGIGTIGLSMASSVSRVVGIEIIPQAIEKAKVNAKINNIDNAEFICADTDNLVEILNTDKTFPNVVLLDPPRKGCSKNLLEEILNIKPDKIIYISCNPATLARDLKKLCEASVYKIEKVTPVDLFPRTAHVETVVLLSHKTPDSHINIKVEFGEGEGKILLNKIAERAEVYKPKEKVTYKMIMEYIEAKYGFKVHTAYIAEVKRDLGLPMYDAPNAVEELKQPRKHPTPVQAEAIKDALKYFEIV